MASIWLAPPVQHGSSYEDAVLHMKPAYGSSTCKLVSMKVKQALTAGDWFKVEKLAKENGADDAEMINAWNKIGQYYSDRHKWGKAAQYYTQVSWTTSNS